MLFILKTLVRWRKLIVFSGLGTAIVMAGISFLLPKWYTASASVFPPETKGVMPFYADIMQSLQLPSLGPTAVGARPGSIYIDIMLSRRVGERIVNEFDYKGVYETPMMFQAIHILHEHTSFSLLDNGLLLVAFEDRDAERAASVTNRYVSLLDEFNQQLNITRASKTREFVANQLESRAGDLRDAELALKRFQEENETLALSEQISSAIEVVSDLTAQAITLEIELDILRQYTSPTSQEYLRKKRHYDGILDQLEKFKVSGAREEHDMVRSFFPTFDRVPDVALDLARLIRRVKTEEKVNELLTQEYERSRIEEARDTPTVQVLDDATVPELRSRPRRKLLVVVGGILGLGWSSMLALLVAFWRGDRRSSGVLRDVIGPILSDFGRLFGKNPQ